MDDWDRDIIVDTKSSLALDSEAWDDTEILEVFDAAIKSHKAKGQQKKISKHIKEKESRSSKNVHFATSCKESATGEEEFFSVDGDTWQRGQWSEEPPSREHRVNFDLSIQAESSTHTDNESSDSGVGSQEWSDRSSSEIQADIAAHRLQQLSGPPPHPPQQQPPSNRPQHTNAHLHSPQQHQQHQQSSTSHARSEGALPGLPKPPAPTAAPLPFTPAPLGASPALSFGGGQVVDSSMETALSDMLMAWYQSGYATARYYTLLETQQQQWQQYYHFQEQQQHGAKEQAPNSSSFK